MDRYFGLLMATLVSTPSQQESEYVALVLSIDGCHHPLLAGLAVDGDCRKWPADFPKERESILRGNAVSFFKILRF